VKNRAGDAKIVQVRVMAMCRNSAPFRFLTWPPADGFGPLPFAETTPRLQPAHFAAKLGGAADFWHRPR
jgi:hypothetical protein